MARYDLACMLFCCKACLGSSDNAGGDEDYYDLLNIDRDATNDEIKKGYKKQSLRMHPDKITQRGEIVTKDDQHKFTMMKEAYEVLSDSHRRETYDSIGKRGLKWVEEPFSMDPMQMAHNFVTSSVIDRSKIFAIFIAISVIIFLLPMLVCLKADGVFGPSATWMLILIPMWLWDAIMLSYRVQLIMIGTIHRPLDVPEEEWVDPLPMTKRIFSFLMFFLFTIFQVLVALRLDGVILTPWALIFLPVYFLDLFILYRNLPLANMKIVTVEDLEINFGKPYAEFTAMEITLVAKKYTVVPSRASDEFRAVHGIQKQAAWSIGKTLVRIVFVVVLVIKIDTNMNWNWWLVFSPLLTMSFCICYGSANDVQTVQNIAANRNPDRFYNGVNPDLSRNGVNPDLSHNGVLDTPVEGDQTPSISDYEAMGDKNNVAESGKGKDDTLSDEEEDEMHRQVNQASSKMVNSCCSQMCVVIIICLLVAKLQGGGYSSVWVISPLLICASIILCFIGCTIFCVSSVNDNGVEFDTNNIHFNGEIYGTAPYSPPQSPPSDLGIKTTKPMPSSDPSKFNWDLEKGNAKNSSPLEVMSPLITSLNVTDIGTPNKETQYSDHRITDVVEDDEKSGLTPNSVNDLD